MKKLTKVSKYSYSDDGDAIIYLRSLSNNKWTPAFTCHCACIEIIKESGRLTGNSGVVLLPIKQSN